MVNNMYCGGSVVVTGVFVCPCDMFQTELVSDVRKKWHVAPTFSVDFVGYYLGL